MRYRFRLSRMCRDRVSWTLKSFVPVVQHSRRIAASCDSSSFDRQAKQWRLRPDVQLSTTILVFRSWQQDLKLENGQGTDAKTMLTLIDVSLQHSDGSSTRWSSICTCTCLRNFMKNGNCGMSPLQLHKKLSSIAASAHNEITYGWEIETWKHVSNVLTWDSELRTWGPAYILSSPPSPKENVTWHAPGALFYGILSTWRTSTVTIYIDKKCKLDFRKSSLISGSSGGGDHPASWHCTVLCVNTGAQNEMKGFPYARNSTEQDVQVEACARATIAFTRARSLCIGYGPLDERQSIRRFVALLQVNGMWNEPLAWLFQTWLARNLVFQGWHQNINTY